LTRRAQEYAIGLNDPCLTENSCRFAGNSKLELMGYLPEATTVEIIHGLDNFLLAVHHEWAMTNNGLVDGFAA
jgi:hypothetical protein